MAFPEPNVCLFCETAAANTPEGELTDEHAYPDWVSQELTPPTDAPRTDVEWRVGGIVVPDRQLFEVVLEHSVCRTCNNDWLSRDLEKKVSTWLRPWLRNVNRRQDVFNHAQRATLAAWATKTALLLELALAKVRGGGFAPQRHFQWLYRHRDHLEPPPRTTVWMFGVAIGAGLGAGIHWTQLAWARAGPLLVPEKRRILVPGEPETRDVPRGYCSTFTAGYVGFQVLGWDLDELEFDNPPSWYRSYDLPSTMEPAVKQVWPAPPRGSMWWPPTRGGRKGEPFTLVFPDEKSMELLAEWLHATPKATVTTIPASLDWQPPS